MAKNSEYVWYQEGMRLFDMTRMRSRWEKDDILFALLAWEYTHHKERDPVHRQMTAKQLKDRFLKTVGTSESLWQAEILAYRQTSSVCRLNQQAVERWYAMDVSRRWEELRYIAGRPNTSDTSRGHLWYRDECGVLRKSQSDPAQWLLSDLENMRLHYVEAKDDPKALRALFPKHTLKEIHQQATRMHLRANVSRSANPHGHGQGRTAQRKAPRRQVSDASRAAARKPKTVPKKSPGRAKRSWTIEEDRLLRRMYPAYGPDMSAWPQKLFGRKKGDITARAEQLGLRFPCKTQPPAASAVQSGGSVQERTRRACAHLKGEALNKRPWESEEDELLRRMYPVYGSDMKAWPQQLFGRKKADIERRATSLGLRREP